MLMCAEPYYSCLHTDGCVDNLNQREGLNPSHTRLDCFEQYEFASRHVADCVDAY